MKTSRPTDALKELHPTLWAGGREPAGQSEKAASRETLADQPPPLAGTSSPTYHDFKLSNRSAPCPSFEEAGATGAIAGPGLCPRCRSRLTHAAAAGWCLACGYFRPPGETQAWEPVSLKPSFDGRTLAEWTRAAAVAASQLVFGWPWLLLSDAGPLGWFMGFTIGGLSLVCGLLYLAPSDPSGERRDLAGPVYAQPRETAPHAAAADRGHGSGRADDQAQAVASLREFFASGDQDGALPCVVIGYLSGTEGEVTGLVLATLRGGRLAYAGTVRRGLTSGDRAELAKRLPALGRAEPLLEGVLVQARWVKPGVYCQVGPCRADGQRSSETEFYKLLG